MPKSKKTLDLHISIMSRQGGIQLVGETERLVTTIPRQCSAGQIKQILAEALKAAFPGEIEELDQPDLSIDGA